MSLKEICILSNLLWLSRRHAAAEAGQGAGGAHAAGAGGLCAPRLHQPAVRPFCLALSKNFPAACPWQRPRGDSCPCQACLHSRLCCCLLATSCWATSCLCSSKPGPSLFSSRGFDSSLTRLWLCSYAHLYAPNSCPHGTDLFRAFRAFMLEQLGISARPQVFPYTPLKASRFPPHYLDFASYKP